MFYKIWVKRLFLGEERKILLERIDECEFKDVPSTFECLFKDLTVESKLYDPFTSDLFENRHY